jgi:hypothetical protein
MSFAGKNIKGVQHFFSTRSDKDDAKDYAKNDMEAYLKVHAVEDFQRRGASTGGGNVA